MQPIGAWKRFLSIDCAESRVCPGEKAYLHGESVNLGAHLFHGNLIAVDLCLPPKVYVLALPLYRD